MGHIVHNKTHSVPAGGNICSVVLMIIPVIFCGFHNSALRSHLMESRRMHQSPEVTGVTTVLVSGIAERVQGGFTLGPHNLMPPSCVMGIRSNTSVSMPVLHAATSPPPTTHTVRMDAGLNM